MQWVKLYLCRFKELKRKRETLSWFTIILYAYIFNNWECLNYIIRVFMQFKNLNRFGALNEYVKIYYYNFWALMCDVSVENIKKINFVKSTNFK